MSHRRTRLLGVYVIRNTVSGKCYVGSSSDIHHRWYRHRQALGKGTHHSSRLQAAWVKHGEAAFEFTVLELVHDMQEITEREQSWIDALSAYGVGYNLYPIARSTMGATVSDETRAKLSAAAKARVTSPETLQLLRTVRKGCKNTPEQNAKIAAWHLGRKKSPEAVAKVAATNRAKGQARRQSSAQLTLSLAPHGDD